MTAISKPLIDVRLERWLREQDVEFDVHPHARTYTAIASARAEGVAPETFVKVVAVRTDAGRIALIGLDATDDLDLAKLDATIGSNARLATETELAEACPDWEVGTVPPIPGLARVQVFADEGVRADPRISFAAGSHDVAVRVDRAAWETAADIVYGDLAREGRPQS